MVVNALRQGSHRLQANERSITLDGLRERSFGFDILGTEL